MSGILEIEGLTVEQDAGVLLDISHFALELSVVTVVTGGTDSGKTLLAAVLLGRAEASGGSVRIDGRRLAGSPSTRRRQGIAGTVADGGRISGCTVSEALHLSGSARTKEALERFPLLEARREVRAELLSGGEHQVLQLVCAWCSAPRVLVLDAPTTGLAADVGDDVASLARDAAVAGSAVLWLDQSDAAAPQPATWRLRSGVLSSATEEDSPSDR